MRKYMVIGLGRFGYTLARELAALGGEVLALDVDHDLVDRVAPHVALAIAADVRDPAVLASQNAGEMDCAVVAIGRHFEANVLATAHLVELGTAQVIARAETEDQKAILQKVGAHQVIMPNDEMAARLARAVHLQGVVDFIELPDGYCFKQVPVPAALSGRTLSELSMRQKERVLVIRIRRQKPAAGVAALEASRAELIAIPDGSTILQSGDLLSVIGSEEAVDAFGRLG